MKAYLLEALKAIDVAQLNYKEWVSIGMSLHAEGFPCEVWDTWSQNDSRYSAGECERKWRSFHGNGSPVTGGTIVQLAKERGWCPSTTGTPMEWDALLHAEAGSSAYAHAFPVSNVKTPAEELITYMELLFEPDDLVAYVTNDVWQDNNGKWLPSKGICDRTAGELIAELRKYPDDIGAVLGDWKEEAGAWIRFNPVDGHGVRNQNITRFKYALVESDTLSIEEQYAVYRKLELPITCLVHSGGKSLHAIVRVDARDMKEYYERVDYLYKYLENNGVAIDKQNRNPSRLSRMPGVNRNGNPQHLVATNIGRKNWYDWLNFAEQISDGLPDIVTLEQFAEHQPALPDELIQGVLRCSHKMLIAGSSKAAKSFLLLELAIAIAEGIEWLGFKCKQGRVLYVNLEIDPASCINRFYEIYDAMGLARKHMDNICIWNLRGHAIPLDELAPNLIQRLKNQRCDAIIIDPIYKVITGDENSATDMGYFCNQFDIISEATGAAVIYCHHHSKGIQGSKRAMDRSSGSGVFARDPDAVLDMIQLEVSDNIKTSYGNTEATAWRMECSLREFRNFKPINFWFSYPLHEIDTMGALEKAAPEGSWQANLSKSSKHTTKESRLEALEMAVLVCSANPPVKVADLAEYMGVSQKTVVRHLQEFNKYFWHERGIVGRKNENEIKES